MMMTPPPSPLNKVARIEAILALIPAGRVVSYGQVADLAGLPGRARQLTQGSDLTLVSWGNTVAHCEEVTSVLAAHGATVDLFDLRCLSPWDAPAIVASATKRLKRAS